MYLLTKDTIFFSIWLDLIIFPFLYYRPARATVEKHHMGVFFGQVFQKKPTRG